jgi:hypothetical protein
MGFACTMKHFAPLTSREPDRCAGAGDGDGPNQILDGMK